MVVIHKKKERSEEEKAAEKLKAEEQALGIQDEYQAKGFELVSWVQHHKRAVSIVIIAIFLIGGILSGYAYYQQRAQEAATTAYIEALQPLESASGAPVSADVKLEVQKSLAALAEKYPSAGPTLLAELYAGHLALLNKDGAAALDFYARARKRMKATNELFPLALIGLGYAEESNGNPKEALNRFVEVVDLKSGLAKDLALWEAARLAMESKETEKAKTFVNRLLEEFPASIFEKDAKRLQESLL